MVAQARRLTAALPLLLLLLLLRPPLLFPHEGVERALEQLAERKAVRGGDRRELLLHARGATGAVSAPESYPPSESYLPAEGYPPSESYSLPESYSPPESYALTDWQAAM